MNVPNQFCEFTDLKCISIEIISPTCKTGYNKYACKNVKGVTC